MSNFQKKQNNFKQSQFVMSKRVVCCSGLHNSPGILCSRSDDFEFLIEKTHESVVSVVITRKCILRAKYFNIVGQMGLENHKIKKLNVKLHFLLKMKLYTTSLVTYTDWFRK